MAFGAADLCVLGGYFLAILAVGVWFGRGERTTDDFFLGGRRQPWLIVGLSIVATEVSALTFIGVPADAFNGDWSYLQMYAGAFLGRMLIIWLLLPAFYGGSVTTVYEYLGQRFGPGTRTTASLMFFASRILGSGIRLLAASIAIAVVFQWSLTWVIIGCAAVAIAYTTFGGIKAIIWTDALQAFVFLGGGVAVVLFFALSTDGGLSALVSRASESEKLHVVTWSLDPNNVRSFWVLTIHATILNMAALGTDQDLTQRMLTCPDLRRGQRSLLLNAFMGLPIVCLFLLIGSLIWSYFEQAGVVLPPDVIKSRNQIFPHFIAHVLPRGYGIKGLLVAGIFAAAMSSLDSALGAMSSTAVTDFYRPLNRFMRRGRVAPAGANGSDERELLIARGLTLFFGVVLACVAIAFQEHDDLLWEAFKWVGLIVGGMLGVFLLGVTTKHRGHDVANVAAMLTSVIGLVLIKHYQEATSVVYIAWPWWVVIGTGWTFGVGACFRTRDARRTEPRP